MHFFMQIGIRPDLGGLMKPNWAFLNVPTLASAEGEYTTSAVESVQEVRISKEVSQVSSWKVSSMGV